MKQRLFDLAVIAVVLWVWFSNPYLLAMALNYGPGRAVFWACIGAYFCGAVAASAVVASDDLWWRRAAFGLPAAAGVWWLAAWDPLTLIGAALGAAVGVWGYFKESPAGGRPSPAS